MSCACPPAALSRRPSRSSSATFALSRASLWRQITASRIRSRFSAVGTVSSLAHAAEAGAAPVRAMARAAVTTARKVRDPWFILELRVILRSRRNPRNGHSSRFAPVHSGSGRTDPPDRRRALVPREVPREPGAQGALLDDERRAREPALHRRGREEQSGAPGRVPIYARGVSVDVSRPP